MPPSPRTRTPATPEPHESTTPRADAHVHTHTGTHAHSPVAIFAQMARSAGAALCKRPRWSGEDGLVHILAAYISSPVRVSYGERLGRSRLDARVLVTHAPLLQALRRLQPNLSFSQAPMKAALAEVAEQNAVTWRLTPGEIDKFSEKVAKRIRTMCAHMAAAQRKNPKWVEKVLVAGDRQAAIQPCAPLAASSSNGDGGHSEQPKPNISGAAISGDDGDEEGDEGDGESEQPSVDDDEPVDDTEVTHYFVGYDEFLEKVWRVPSHLPDAAKEFAKYIQCAPHAEDEDPVQAVWSDGYTSPVAALTVEKHRLAGQRNSGASAMFYYGDYAIKKTFDNRKNRLLIISPTRVKGKQICQINATNIGDENVALEILKEVLKRIVDDGAQDPYAERDAIMEARGYAAKKIQ